MPIKISNQLKKRLPDDQVKGLEDYLWSKYQTCHLCSKPLNRTTDTIEADHDDPTAEGGKQNRDNLWLAHKKCNAFKKNNPSIYVRPYLQFEAFLESKPVNVKYGECLEHFDITPVPLFIEFAKNEIKFHLPNGKIKSSHIFKEKIDQNELEYVYIEVPKNVIFNDEECQPRVIKPKQVWAIYSDLHINPLYEAPGCRLEKDKDPKLFKFLMFDGQHKTLAAWLLNRDSIVVKLYLNLTKFQANQLVNSIQGTIKKLPLSALEQSVKMSDEWKDLFQEYTQLAGEEASEAGFIDHLPAARRARAKTALKASFIDRLVRNEDLEILDYVDGISNEEDNSKFLLEENKIKTKVFEKLLYSKPLKVGGSKGADLREREHKNIVRLLNIFVSEAWEPKGNIRSKVEETRIERMQKQSSLSYISTLLKKTVRQVLSLDNEDRALMDKEIGEESWEKISAAIERLVSHPVWTGPFEQSKKMKAIKDSLDKNQDVESSFKNVELTVGYLVGADELSANCLI